MTTHHRSHTMTDMQKRRTVKNEDIPDPWSFCNTSKSKCCDSDQSNSFYKAFTAFLSSPSVDVITKANSKALFPSLELKKLELDMASEKQLRPSTLSQRCAKDKLARLMCYKIEKNVSANEFYVNNWVKDRTAESSKRKKHDNIYTYISDSSLMCNRAAVEKFSNGHRSVFAQKLAIRKSHSQDSSRQSRKKDYSSKFSHKSTENFDAEMSGNTKRSSLPRNITWQCAESQISDFQDKNCKNLRSSNHFSRQLADLKPLLVRNDGYRRKLRSAHNAEEVSKIASGVQKVCLATSCGRRCVSPFSISEQDDGSINKVINKTLCRPVFVALEKLSRKKIEQLKRTFKLCKQMEDMSKMPDSLKNVKRGTLPYDCSVPLEVINVIKTEAIHSLPDFMRTGELSPDSNCKFSSANSTASDVTSCYDITKLSNDLLTDNVADNVADTEALYHTQSGKTLTNSHCSRNTKASKTEICTSDLLMKSPLQESNSSKSCTSFCEKDADSGLCRQDLSNLLNDCNTPSSESQISEISSNVDMAASEHALDIVAKVPNSKPVQKCEVFQAEEFMETYDDLNVHQPTDALSVQVPDASRSLSGLVENDRRKELNFVESDTIDTMINVSFPSDSIAVTKSLNVSKASYASASPSQGSDERETLLIASGTIASQAHQPKISRQPSFHHSAYENSGDAVQLKTSSINNHVNFRKVKTSVNCNATTLPVSVLFNHSSTVSTHRESRCSSVENRNVFKGDPKSQCTSGYESFSRFSKEKKKLQKAINLENNMVCKESCHIDFAMDGLKSNKTSVLQAAKAKKRKSESYANFQNMAEVEYCVSDPYVPNFMTHSAFSNSEANFDNEWNEASDLEEWWLNDRGNWTRLLNEKILEPSLFSDVAIKKPQKTESYRWCAMLADQSEWPEIDFDCITDAEDSFMKDNGDLSLLKVPCREERKTVSFDPNRKTCDTEIKNCQASCVSAEVSAAQNKSKCTTKISCRVGKKRQIQWLRLKETRSLAEPKLSESPSLAFKRNRNEEKEEIAETKVICVSAEGTSQSNVTNLVIPELRNAKNGLLDQITGVESNVGVDSCLTVEIVPEKQTEADNRQSTAARNTSAFDCIFNAELSHSESLTSVGHSVLATSCADSHLVQSYNNKFVLSKPYNEPCASSGESSFISCTRASLNVSHCPVETYNHIHSAASYNPTISSTSSVHTPFLVSYVQTSSVSVSSYYSAHSVASYSHNSAMAKYSCSPHPASNDYGFSASSCIASYSQNPPVVSFISNSHAALCGALPKLSSDYSCHKFSAAFYNDASSVSPYSDFPQTTSSHSSVCSFQSCSDTPFGNSFTHNVASSVSSQSYGSYMQNPSITSCVNTSAVELHNSAFSALSCGLTSSVMSYNYAAHDGLTLPNTYEQEFKCSPASDDLRLNFVSSWQRGSNGENAVLNKDCDSTTELVVIKDIGSSSGIKVEDALGSFCNYSSPMRNRETKTLSFTFNSALENENSGASFIFGMDSNPKMYEKQDLEDKMKACRPDVSDFPSVGSSESNGLAKTSKFYKGSSSDMRVVFNEVSEKCPATCSRKCLDPVLPLVEDIFQYNDCNSDMCSWLAASMGLCTCNCGAAFSDSWSCQQHQSRCTSLLKR